MVSHNRRSAFLEFLLIHIDYEEAILSILSMNLEKLTELFQWMSIINFWLLLIISMLVVMLKNTIKPFHGKLFGITEEQVAIMAYGSNWGVFQSLVSTILRAISAYRASVVSVNGMIKSKAPRMVSSRANPQSSHL